MIDEALGPLCAALQLPASESQLRALAQYLDLLQRWNSTYNLTAVRERGDMLRQHLADCLAAVRPLLRQCPQGRVLDVGSGGGLPGVVLAILAPALDVTCVDTVGKKAAFVRQAAGALHLNNLHAAHCRVEALRAPGFDVITSRAFAPLRDFAQLSHHLLQPAGVWMAMKGKLPTDEMAQLPSTVAVFHVEPLVVPGLAAERCLVWMKPAL